MHCRNGCIPFTVVMLVMAGLTGCNQEGAITDASPDPDVVITLGLDDRADFSVDGTAPARSRYMWFRDDPYGSQQVGNGSSFNFELSELNTNRILIRCELQVFGIDAGARPVLGWHTRDERQWRIRVAQDPPVWQGTYILDSQTELDILSEFSAVTDQLLILNTDLASLEDLSGLTAIGGTLRIHATSGVTDLDGLQNVTSVGGDLFIYNNTALVSLDGLHNITAISGNMELHGNDALHDLTGLRSLASVGGHVSMYHNDMLPNLSGLGSLASIGGILEIVEHAGITSLDGLGSGLTIIDGNLSIIENSALRDVEALHHITRVDGDLMIVGNDALTTLTGLRTLVSIGESLYIDHNGALTSLGLDALDSVGNNTVWYRNDFLISANPELCTYLAEDLRDQVRAGEGIGGRVEIRANKDCSTLGASGTLLE